MSTGLRIAVLARAVYPAHGVGGLERHVFDLVRHLARRGHDVTLISRPGTLSPPLAEAGPGHVTAIEVPYRSFPLAGRRGTTILDRDTAYPIFGWRAGRRALQLVRAGHIDLVYGLGASAFGYAAARSRTGGAAAPLVFNPQGLEEFGATDPSRARLKRMAYLPLRTVVRHCAHAADRVVATDRVLVPVVRQHLGLDAERVRVVPNGVDLDACDALAGPEDGRRLRERLGLLPATPLLLSVGRIERNKGFDILARALARLVSRPWTWVIVGSGPFSGQLEQVVARAGLSGRVRQVGRVADAELHGWYEAADWFVHPTLYEGSSLVTLEAMAHRRPVIASAAGGLPDKVIPGTNGWLVPPGDVAALAGALDAALALKDPTPMGAASRRLVETTFSWDRVTDVMLAVYKEVLPRAAARRIDTGPQHG